jgi:rare lipoprotein A
MGSRTGLVRPLVAMGLAVCLCASPAPLSALGALPTPQPATIDEATRRAHELETTIIDLNAERIAIDTRIQVTNDRIVEQSAGLERARSELTVAQTTLNERAVAMYKSTGYDELAILLTADSWQDLVTRVAVISHILDVDRRALEEAAVVAAQAQYQASALDDLRAQDASLRQLQEQRVRLIDAALSEQRDIVAGLLPASQSIVTANQAEQAGIAQEWKDSSVPLGTQIRVVRGRVSPRVEPYLVSELHERAFRVTGISYSAVCSWYGPGFNGKPTASGQLYNQDDFTCASRTLALGTWLALSRGGKRVVVVVTDRGPFVAGRDIDLSKAAAAALGVSGVESVQVEVVTPQ